MSMTTTSSFASYVGKDLSAAFAISNPSKSATLSLMIANGKVGEEQSPIFQRIVKALNKTASGGKAEGAAAATAVVSTDSAVQNYMEIFSKTASISGTAKKLNGGRYDEEINDRMAEIKEDINKAIVIGTSASSPRKMCGLINYENAGSVETEDAVFTEAELDEAIQKLGTTGNVHLAVNPANMFAVQQELVGDKAQVVINPDISATAGINVTKYISAQGCIVTIYAESALTAGTYVLYDMDKVEYLEFRPIHVEDLGKVGDSDEALVVAEVSNIASPYSVVVITEAEEEEEEVAGGGDNAGGGAGAGTT